MKTKTNNKTVARECEKYQLDLTDYVTGDMTFLTKKKQQQLFDHLRQCAKCREEFFDWEETFGVMVTEHHLARPEIKKKMNDMIEQLKRESVKGVPEVEVLPGEKFSNHEEDIGKVAGVLWHCLGENGRVKESGLERKVGMSVKTFNRAIGWLSCQSKIHRTRVKKIKFVYLTEPEREIYQQEQAQI